MEWHAGVYGSVRTLLQAGLIGINFLKLKNAVMRMQAGRAGQGRWVERMS